jgi:hypothetical protein
MPTKLTEPQRAYMFANWTPENTERMYGPEGRCDQPWNKVDTKGPHAARLNAVKAMARAAHPAAGAFNPYATAKARIAKKARSCGTKKRTGARLDAAGECPPAGDQDELCASCGLWVSTCDCEADSDGAEESDGEEEFDGRGALGPSKFVGARWAWRPDAEFVPRQPPCSV